jgi:hypothetical protein
MKYIISALTLLLVACGPYPQSSDQKAARQQEQISMAAVNAVGMPAITKFAEKRMMKDILEMRDQEVSTYTYTQDMNGHLHLLCHSVGFGLPYSTQYTNPQVDTYYGTSSSIHMSMPQADPNGLFSPVSAEGTWVLCLNPETKRVQPLYIEPRVIVSPFALNE